MIEFQVYLQHVFERWSRYKWKWRMNQEWTLNGGAHFSYFALNGKYSVEPRLSAAYEKGKNRFSLAAGLHSKPEHISTYMFRSPAANGKTVSNQDLDLLRAFHAVAGYNTLLSGGLRLKAELYYQHLYSIPVEQDTASGFSIINAGDAYSLLSTKSRLVSEGTGTNYGLDLSLERPFESGWYMLASGSVYKSTYETYGGAVYNTRFNRGYQANLIGGKEFRLGTNGKRLLGLNGKILYNGGLRESRIDIGRSVASGETAIVPGEYFTKQSSPYFRTDMS
ncbi:MAG: hypothetical protein EOP49_48710, partial [Sphingobacteriales bacterium]